MQSLITTNSNPFKSVQFRQKAAQPAASDLLAIEKQKALSRYRLIARHAGRESLLRSSQDDSCIQKIQDVFDLSDLKLSFYPTAFTPESSAAFTFSPEDSGVNVQYILQRGKFEFRVAVGDIEYTPALEMTIFTSYPDIDFEYTGSLCYSLPAEDIQGSSLNLQI